MDFTPREQILLSAVEGCLARLTDTASRLLGCPLLLGDTLLNVLAWTGEAQRENWTWDDFIAAGLAPEFQAQPEGSDQARIIPYGFTATPIAARNRTAWYTLVDLELGHGLSAHLVAVGLGPDCDPEADELLGVLCLSIQGLLRPDRDPSFLSLSAGQFLLQLLREEEMDEALLRFRAGLTGLEPEGRFALLLVELRDYHPVTAAISTVCDRLRALTGGPYAIDQELLILLVQGNGRTPDQLWDRLAALLREHGLQGVYSPWFYRLADAAHHYRQSARALALRQCALETKALYSSEELSVYLLADLLCRSEGRLSVDQPVLLALAEADKGGKTSYLETLFTYLSCAQHAGAACARLHIHRNTLDYRLRRMEELAHIDWSDGDLLFRLYFSLCALRYRQLHDL